MVIVDGKAQAVIEGTSGRLGRPSFDSARLWGLVACMFALAATAKASSCLPGELQFMPAEGICVTGQRLEIFGREDALVMHGPRFVVVCRVA